MKTAQRKTFLTWWIGGILVFLVVIALGLPLGITAVPGGILDHQAAGNAAAVNAIHAAWGSSGLMDSARNAIIADLVFIGIYGTGCVLGGRYFRSTGTGILRHLGTVIVVLGVVFLLTDYGETISQFLQVVANEGSDRLAGIAATLRPIKVIAFLAVFIGIVIALLLEWKQRRT